MYWMDNLVQGTIRYCISAVSGNDSEFVGSYDYYVESI